MSILSKSDIHAVYPARYPVNKKTMRLANDIMDELWAERNLERGLASDDRSGSCKFAALLVRNLFGGMLAGSQRHVFVLRNGEPLDLNIEQKDVLDMGDNAHVNDGSLSLKKYRESLSSCLPRVRRWITVFEQRYQEMAPGRAMEIF